MPYTPASFVAFLNAPLEASDVYLPLAASPYADLLKTLTADKCLYTYLTISDDTHMETVKAWAEGGVIMLDRGIAPTEPYKFGYGACVRAVSPTIYAAFTSADEWWAKQILCKQRYAYNPDAMLSPLGIALENLPDGEVGEPYGGYIIFNGALPIEFDIKGVPDWLAIDVADNMVEISGTPLETQVVVFTITATNITDDYDLKQSFSFTIKRS